MEKNKANKENSAILPVVIDVSNLKRTVEQYNQLMQTNPIDFTVIEKTGDTYSFIQPNDYVEAWEQLSGFKSGKIVGKLLVELRRKEKEEKDLTAVFWPLNYKTQDNLNTLSKNCLILNEQVKNRRIFPNATTINFSSFGGESPYRYFLSDNKSPYHSELYLEKDISQL